MAEWSLGWSTNGTGDGISGGYTQAKFTEWMEALLTQNNATNGVLKNYGSALAVSASGGSASPVTIQNGAGMVKGFFYRNDAAGTLNIPTPAAATRIDRIVMWADWGSQVVRFKRSAGAEGGAAPALTQTDGTTWEISLATVSTTTGGVATVTDARTYANYNTEISTNMIAAGAVTTVKILNANVTAAKLATDSVETAKIKDANVTLAKMAADSVNASKIVNRTRTFFVQAVYGVDTAGDVLARNGNYGFTHPNNAGTAGSTFAYGHATIPADYVSGFSAVFRLYTTVTATGTVFVKNIASYIPTVNAAYTSGTVWDGLVGVEGPQQFVSTAVTLSGIGAGDTLALRAGREAGTAQDTYAQDVYSPGWIVSYTADS